MLLALSGTTRVRGGQKNLMPTFPRDWLAALRPPQPTIPRPIRTQEARSGIVEFERARFMLATPSRNRPATSVEGHIDEVAGRRNRQGSGVCNRDRQIPLEDRGRCPSRIRSLSIRLILRDAGIGRPEY